MLWKISGLLLTYAVSFRLCYLLSPMRFLKNTLLAALLLVSPVVGQAQKAAARPAKSTSNSNPAPANALLWEISGKGLAAPSYVFGTMHLICPADLRVSEPLKQAFGNTRQLVLELDTDDPDLMAQMQARMMMTGGQQLQQLLSPADYASVGAYLQSKAGIPIDKVSSFKPFILSSMLYPALLGCAPASYEGTFTQMAQDQKKEVLGLETVQDQMGIFEKIPYAEQGKMLADMVNKEAEARAETQQMVALYKAQNVEELRTMTTKSMFGFQQYEDMLVNTRNQNWIAPISRLAAAQPTFFAVGAAHLGGPKGVLALLRQQGYQVRPVAQ